MTASLSRKKSGIERSENELQFFGPRLGGLLLSFFLLLLIFHSSEKDQRLLLKTHGSGHVIVTAPHGISHQRNGLLKPADADTTAIATKLSQKAPNEVTAIVWEQKTAKKSALRNGWQIDDPNYMPLEKVKSSPFYKLVSANLIGHEKDPFLVDLHGMKDLHDGISCDVSLGFGAWLSVDAPTANLFRNCFVNELIAHLPSKYKIDCLDRFSGNKNREKITLSRTAAVIIRIPAFQVELSRRLRAEMVSSDEALDAFYDALNTCADSVLYS